MSFLNNLSIAKRLSLGFGLLVMMLLSLGSMSLWHGSHVHTAVHELSDNLMPKQRRLVDIENEINDIARAIRNLLIMDKESDLQEQRNQIQTSRAQIVSHTEWLEERIINPDAKRLFEDVKRERATFYASLERYLSAHSAGQMEEARRLLLEETRPLQLAYVKTLRGLTEFQNELSTQGVLEIDEALLSLKQVTAAVLLFGVVFATLLAVSITRSVTRPIGEAVELANAVAEGDLTKTIVPLGRSETGQLLKALNTMQQSLIRVVSNVRQGADGVAIASVQIAQGNNDLSARTEQQASALEEASASMEQMGSTASQNADNARAASQLAASASSVAVQGGDVVSQVVQTMKDINDSSKKISDIIGVIDGIAFQTNILALNAAVEAARAGEQGRGFAVVAGEVRNLAQRSAEAAKEIKGLIGASVERVEQGTALVDRAGSTMQEVVQSIQRVTDIVGEISSASQEQNAGVNQVSEAVSSMDQTTQQNAALVEQSAAAASSLQTQAQQLVQAVSVFRLPGGAAATTQSAPAAPAAKAPPVSRPAPVAKPVAKVASKPDAKPDASQHAAPPKAAAAATAVAAGGGGDDWESF